MKEELKEQEATSKMMFKKNSRERALQTALSMQPINYSQTGLQNVNKSVNSLLTDAETIYNWLIKDL